MKILKKICPVCGHKLQFNLRDDADVSNKKCKCPGCGFKDLFSAYRDQAAGNAPKPAPAPQPLAPQPTPGITTPKKPVVEETRVAEETLVHEVPIRPQDRLIGSFYIDGKEFSLKEGRQLVGRCAKAKCQADIKIPTDDMYMSRHHAYFTVNVKPGGTTEHMVETAEAKNAIYVNGKKMEQDDKVLLRFGDKLRFGHTTVTFDRSSFFDGEQTYYDAR